jgi:ribosomal protein S18 acetylase RimI-like enzyme
MSNQIDIKFVKNWSIDDIVQLYKAGGWWKDHYSPKDLEYLIKGSFVFAVVIDKKNNKTIGMARILSDGVSDAYIQDLIILPEYRKKGIGKKLLKKLVKYCLSKGILWIGLISEPGQDGFYQSYGFKIMKNYTPMLFQKED